MTRSDLPMHYELMVWRILKHSDSWQRKRFLLDYLSENLLCASFITNGSMLITSGLSNLLDYSEFEDIHIFKKLLCLFESIAALNKFNEENFTLHPVSVLSTISIDGHKVENISFISTDIGFYKFGLLGSAGMNTDLALSILDYVKEYFQTFEI